MSWRDSIPFLRPGRYEVEIGDNLRDVLLSQSTSLLPTILSEIRIMAASISDIRAAVAEQGEAITTEIEQINAKLDALQQTITEGGTEADREELLSDIRSATARISGIVADDPVGPVEPGDDEPVEG